jgi:hypothetical protein
MRIDSRRNGLLLLIAASAIVPAVAHAQMRGGGGGGLGPMPVGVPLDKVPVGTWAEYTVKRGDQPARKLRQALVGREAGAYVLESRTEGANGNVITHVVVDPDPTKEGGVKKVVMQMGTGDPMEMPAPGAGGGGGGGPDGNRGGGRGGAGAARFAKPDPKKLVGKETLKVAGGTFQTEHYREQGQRGGTIDYWIAKDAGPLGLVKMDVDRPAGGNGQGGGKSTVELAARGKGAVAEVTKPAKPADPEALRQMFGNRGGRGGPDGQRGPGGGEATPPAPPADPAAKAAPAAKPEPAPKAAPAVTPAPKK